MRLEAGDLLIIKELLSNPWWWKSNYEQARLSAMVFFVYSSDTCYKLLCASSCNNDELVFVREEDITFFKKLT